ncbi:MAG: TrkA family potassium uptake protein [Thermoanaerobaculia bacterium]|nr:TrkA family potassium uptake protein [Thermoanaerobaculia bacterium]
MPRQFAVIGLGNFGAQLAVELSRRGAEVLAIDEREQAVDDLRDHVTHTVRLDATDDQALSEQRVAEMDAVVVSFGNDFEAALLTISVLKQIGVKRIIVRATTVRHERILESIGVDEVVLPVSETVSRLAGSLMVEGLYDSFALSADFAVGEVGVPEELLGKKVGEIDFPADFGVSLVTIRRIVPETRILGLGTRMVERILGIPSPATPLERGDTLVVFGSKKALEKLAGRKRDG